VDETIEILLRKRRKENLDAAFESDKMTSRKFWEEDRLDDGP